MVDDLPRCRSCGEPIGPHDDVLFLKEGGVAHVRCRARDRRPADAVCPVCSIGIAVGDKVVTVGDMQLHVACHASRIRRNGEERKTEVTCASCGAPFAADDHLVYDGLEFVHLDCHERTRAGTAVSDFLRTNPGQAFCHSCLALGLGLRWETVRKAVSTLRVLSGFAVRPASCSRCGAPRVTIAFVETTERGS